MTRKTKKQLERELEIALLDRDQLAGLREAELLERDTEIKELRSKVKRFERKPTRMQIRPFGELDAPDRSVYEVVLTSYDEHYAPPDQEVLRVCLGGGDVIFFEIAGVDAAYEQTTYLPHATFGVKLEVFEAALGLLKAHGW